MRFIVNRCYSEVTPESSEDGDFSATGFVYRDEVMTLSELKEYIRREGFFREGRGTGWLSNGWDTVCYRTGTGREETLHIKLASSVTPAT